MQVAKKCQILCPNLDYIDSIGKWSERAEEALQQVSAPPQQKRQFWKNIHENAFTKGKETRWEVSSLEHSNKMHTELHHVSEVSSLCLAEQQLRLIVVNKEELLPNEHNVRDEILRTREYTRGTCFVAWNIHRVNVSPNGYGSIIWVVLPYSLLFLLNQINGSTSFSKFFLICKTF